MCSAATMAPSSTDGTGTLMHYTHNMSGEPPPSVDKPSKKGPSAAKVLSAKDKATLLLAVGL